MAASKKAKAPSTAPLPPESKPKEASPKPRPKPPILKKGERGTRRAVEGRIAHIADMMRNVTWIRGVSGPELARQWGLCAQRVEELSAEASKRVRAEVLDPESIRMDVSAALKKVIRDSMADGDRRHLIQATKVLSWAMGTAAPMRVQLTEMPLERLSDSEREALVKEALATLDPKKVKGS